MNPLLLLFSKLYNRFLYRTTKDRDSPETKILDQLSPVWTDTDSAVFKYVKSKDSSKFGSKVSDKGYLKYIDDPQSRYDTTFQELVIVESEDSLTKSSAKILSPNETMHESNTLSGLLTVDDTEDIEAIKASLESPDLWGIYLFI